MCDYCDRRSQMLAPLEGDTHEHIHKENNVLLPAAIELAST